MIESNEQFRQALLEMYMRYAQELNVLRNSLEDTDIGSSGVWKSLMTIEGKLLKEIPYLIGQAGKIDKQGRSDD